MSKQLNLLQNLINNLSTRERVLVLLGILSVIYIIWDTFLITPIQASTKVLLDQRMAIQEQTVNLETRRILASGLLKNSKRKKILSEIKVVEKQIKNFDGKILERLQGRVAPQYMASLLNDVLNNNRNLELISINNLPARPLVVNGGDKKSQNKTLLPKDKTIPSSDPRLVGIFQHSLEMELQGSYLDILNYLQALESLEWKMFWDQVDLEVIDHPRVKVKIKVHTFSLKDGWISV